MTDEDPIIRFQVLMKKSTVDQLEAAATQRERSKNQLANIIIREWLVKDFKGENHEDHCP